VGGPAADRFGAAGIRAIMSGWWTAFIAATFWELKASSPCFMSASRCAVRSGLPVVVVMRFLIWSVMRKVAGGRAPHRDGITT
jgi:hypothetical protein